MKRLLKQIDDCTALYRDPSTGIAWVEDGHAGIGHSCHPNISDSGSSRGMIQRGYWNVQDRLATSHGFIYNTDRLILIDELDLLAEKHCCCVACSERRVTAS